MYKHEDTTKPSIFDIFYLFKPLSKKNYFVTIFVMKFYERVMFLLITLSNLVMDWSVLDLDYFGRFKYSVFAIILK